MTTETRSSAGSPDGWAELFRAVYELAGELVAQSRQVDTTLLARMESLQDDLAVTRGMLVDLRADVGVQVTATEAETARLQSALRGVEAMLGRVSVRLDSVASLPVPPRGIAMIEEGLHR